MNKYPGFIPPGSGYIDYPFAQITHHLGMYNNMDWDHKLPPSSYYHPYYIHSINDNLLSLRDPATAATIEMGVGKHIAEIAKFANMYNLGYSNQRVGVGYFKTIGISGGVSWWNDPNGLSSIVVQSGFAGVNVKTDKVIIVSGYVSESANFHIDASNPNMVITSTGSGYLDKIEDKEHHWTFDYGNVRTVDNINLFNNIFKIYNTGSGILTTLNDITFTQNVQIKDLYISGLVSGFYDTYLKVGLSDLGLINYSAVGHTHNASGWMLSTVDYPIVGNTIFDGTYYYAVSNNRVLKMDSNGIIDNWLLTEYQGIYNVDSRVFKDNIDLNVVNTINPITLTNPVPTTMPTNRKLGDKVATINGLILCGAIGYDTLNISDGRVLKLDGKITAKDEFYFIDSNIYFVHQTSSAIRIYQFNGQVWKSWTYNTNATFINSWLSNSEIFLFYRASAKIFRVTRFNTIGVFTSDTFSRTLFGEPKQLAVMDHDIVCLAKDFIDNKTYNVYVYNINNVDKYQRIFSGLSGGSLSIYHNSQYNFVQVGNVKRKIGRNKSANLPLDSIGGLLKVQGEVKVNGNVTSKSVIMALCKDSLFADINPIYKHLFLLEPGRMKDGNFTYTGTFLDTYINRYVYNVDCPSAYVYNDMTCSIVFNNIYYFGHRGDISAFLKNNNQLQITPSKMADKIIAKFLPLDNSLYALVQDFSCAYKDFVYELPTSPRADELEDEFNNVTDFIPYLPGPWSIPVTKLYYKPSNSNEWKENTTFTDKYGLNMIDAISHDNNIYILTHDNSGSGIASYKFNPQTSIETPLSFSGCLKLNESLVGSTARNVELWEYIPEVGGVFKRALSGAYKDEYPRQISANTNGHHEFYMYNHPYGPYVVHDQVEVMYDQITPSSIYAWQPDKKHAVESYAIKNRGSKYNYRTLNVTFLQEELDRPDRIVNNYDTNIQTPPQSIHNPTIKIPIAKEHPSAITSSVETDKFLMKDIAQDKANNRKNIHFITSVTHNKQIYLLVQVDEYLRIYCVRDFNDYALLTPNLSSALNIYNSPNTSTIFGDGLSYMGIKTHGNFMPSGTYGNAFFLDFIPCELSNTLVTEININEIIGPQVTPISIQPVQANPPAAVAPMSFNFTTPTISQPVVAPSVKVAPVSIPALVTKSVDVVAPMPSFTFTTPTIKPPPAMELPVFAPMPAFTFTTPTIAPLPPVKIPVVAPMSFSFTPPEENIVPGEYLWQMSEDGSQQWDGTKWTTPYSSDASVAPETGEDVNTLTIFKDENVIQTASVYILGDGDDLFIQKPTSTNYRHNKRFSTHSTMAVGSNIYVPITCRVNYPTGRLYTFVLGFFSDGSVGLVDKGNVPVQIINKPMGRTQCLFKDGKYIISSIKMVETEPENISYDDIKENKTYGTSILDNIPQSFSSMFNTFAKKRWIIGEYDVTINDNLNVRETL